MWLSLFLASAVQTAALPASRLDYTPIDAAQRISPRAQAHSEEREHLELYRDADGSYNVVVPCSSCIVDARLEAWVEPDGPRRTMVASTAQQSATMNDEVRLRDLDEQPGRIAALDFVVALEDGHGERELRRTLFVELDDQGQFHEVAWQDFVCRALNRCTVEGDHVEIDLDLPLVGEAQ